MLFDFAVSVLVANFTLGHLFFDLLAYPRPIDSFSGSVETFLYSQMAAMDFVKHLTGKLEGVIRRSPFMSKPSQVQSSSLKFQYSLNSGTNSQLISLVALSEAY